MTTVGLAVLCSGTRYKITMGFLSRRLLWALLAGRVGTKLLMSPDILEWTKLDRHGGLWLPWGHFSAAHSFTRKVLAFTMEEMAQQGLANWLANLPREIWLMVVWLVSISPPSSRSVPGARAFLS